MGSADVVPGVSGGTIAFVVGIYEELIDSIRTVARPAFLRPLLRFRLVEAFEAVNGRFLVSLGAGIAIAVLSLAKGIEWMLLNRPVVIWSFFFGLVLASVVVVSMRIRRWSPGLWVAMLAGAIGAYWVVGMVPLQTPETWWFLVLSGAVAICAMILPGISGAFILVLLGKYQFVLSAVNQRDVVTVAWVGLGATIGIVSFAQILGWLFHKYHDPTVALLTGFMLGSLRKVWPWKVDVAFIIDRHGKKVPTIQHDVLPQVGTEIATALVMAAIGFAVVILIERWAMAKEQAEAAAVGETFDPDRV